MKLIQTNRSTLASSTKQEKKRFCTSLDTSTIVITWQLLHPLYTKLAKDNSAQTVLKQRGGPGGIQEKNSKNKTRDNYKASRRVSMLRIAKVKVIMLDKKEQLETFLTNSRYVVC